MKYIKGFDGLRAISIVFVLTTHLGIKNKIESLPFLLNNFNLFSGETGVLIFFSISGFLITSLLLAEKETTGRIHFKNFFARRFLRLLPPLLVLFITVFFLMTSGYLERDYMALIFSFIYLYNFIPYSFYEPELGHTWSLAVEEQFYFFWPFVISQIKTLKRGILFSAAIVLLCIIGNKMLTWPIPINGKSILITAYFFADRFFIPACLPIMVGSLVSMVLFLYRKKVQDLLTANYFILAFAAILFTSRIYFPGFSPGTIQLLQAISASLFLVWIYFNQENLLVKFLELKPIAFIGKISYGLYVYQGLFLRTGPGGSLTIQKYPLNIGLVFITAILSFYLIEKNFLKLKSRFKSATFTEISDSFK